MILLPLFDALAFAAERHSLQRRKDAEASPYINHPIAVARALAGEGIEDLAALCAALLHDTLEDTETSYDELCDRFGVEIADLVAEVTDDKSLPKAERKQRQLEHAPSLSPKARLVKIADKISNLRDVATCPPADWPLERRQAYFDWAKSVVDGVRGTHAGLEARFDEAYAARP